MPFIITMISLLFASCHLPVNPTENANHSKVLPANNETNKNDLNKSDTAELVKDFKSAERTFYINNFEDKRFDWTLLCSNDVSAKTIIQIIFKPNSNNGEITLSCAKDEVDFKSLSNDFIYDIIKTDDESLVLNVNWQARGAGGIINENEASPKGLALLKMAKVFSKADWLYSKNSDQLVGFSQLGKNGIGEYPTTILDNHEKFINALNYQKNDKNNIAPNVPAISFIFNQR